VSADNRKLFGRFVFGLLGLIAIDQAILHFGQKLVASPYWPDSLYSHVAADDWDLLLVGTCRAFYLHNLVLEQLTGKRGRNGR
jgi:hypothetical protein